MGDKAKGRWCRSASGARAARLRGGGASELPKASVCDPNNGAKIGIINFFKKIENLTSKFQCQNDGKFNLSQKFW